jgi:hypothetical protein
MSAPLNFSRYPEWAAEVMASLWAVPTTDCVDDVISVERVSTAASAREAWICFTSETGWLISMEKSPEPSKRFIVIGVCLDLRPWPMSDPLVSVTEKRLQALDATIRKVLIAKMLACGQASSLAGKLGFTITAAFGRVGRAKLRPIINRTPDPEFWTTSCGHACCGGCGYSTCIARGPFHVLFRHSRQLSAILMVKVNMEA